MTEPTIHPSLLLRKVIHVDMDAFYAAVEILDRPELAEKPLIVGGSPKGRGVVLTASYAARRFGVRSAMPAAKAIKLCPKATFVKPRFERYKEISQAVHDIFRAYTDLIEPLSLDEAYLDVTSQSRLARDVASEIRRVIERDVGITASAGIGPNKLVAKIASDFSKPNGQCSVAPAQVMQFLANLPLAKLPGIGPVTARRLAEDGLRLGQDVYDLSLQALLDRYDRLGASLYRKVRGIDERPVAPRRERKSLGHERTFGENLTDPDAIRQALRELADRLAGDLERKGFVGKTLTLKVKRPDFSVSTRSTNIGFQRDREALLETALQLVSQVEIPLQGVRLLGLTLSDLSKESGEARLGRFVQPSLFGD